MARAANPRPSTTPGRWIWLFPVTMLVHVAEEAATGFPAWIRRVARADLSMDEFLILNAIAFAVILVATVLAAWLRRGAWAVAALATALGTNAILHMGGTILTASRSPGVISATLLWVPLSAYALAWSARHASRHELAAGVVVGLAAHGAVSLSLILA
jgi:hypothetical protein